MKRSFADRAQIVAVRLLEIAYLLLKHLVVFLTPRQLQREKDVKGQVVLVTGAGSGLGRLLAIELARRNAILVLCDVNEDGNRETQKMIKQEAGQAHAYYCDVSNRESVYETAKRVKEEVGAVNILVNNAGILVGEDFLDIPDAKIQKTFEVNALGPMWTCKAFLPDMMESNRGHVVNIASMGALIGFPKLTDYAASKHALKGFNDSLKVELYLGGYTGVKTTLVCPTFFNSGLYQGYKSGLLTPELSVQGVSKCIIAAILGEREKVLVPGFGKILTFLQEVVPIDVGMRLVALLGGYDAVKNLKAGRAIPIPDNNNQTKVGQNLN